MIDVPILVKDALRDGRLLKNYRILVLNEDGTTDFAIDNNTLVKETVSIDERMCSGDTIKFGLCEGSSLEFQYFDHPSIYGRQLQVFVDVWSDYAQESDVPIWHDIKVLTETDGTFTVVKPGTYKIDYVGPISFKIEWTRNGVTYHDEIYPMAGADSYPLGDLVAGDTIRAYTDYAFNEFSVDLKGYYADVSHWYTIPMGFFTVEKCSRQASTGIKKVTAYNKLKSAYLDQKANSDIIALFGNQSVYVMDINRALLGEYGIDVKEYSHIDMQWLVLTEGSNASGSFSPYKYTSLVGDQGPFSPGIFNGGISTSTNIYMMGVADVVKYDIPNQYQQKYMQIDMDSIVQQAEQSISEFIKEQLSKIATSTSADVLWSRLQNMVGNPSYDPDILGYFFNVVVKHPGYTYEIYGDNVLNADGSLEDLKHKTFHEVSQVLVVIPKYITFGTIGDSYGHVERVTMFTDVHNEVWCQGTYGEYVYYTSGGDYYVKQYRPPRLADDSTFDTERITAGIDVKIILSGISDADTIMINPTSIGDVTLRELQSATFETVCQFGKLDRVTDLFAGVELNNSRLFPAENLYPYDSLYPDGAALSSEKSMYSKLWADEGNIQSWRNLIITYKGLDENNQEKDFTLQRQVNADGTQDYNMSDNWLFKNLVWTAEEVGDYADAMVAKMRNITWFPFEMWCAGLPYLETGDELEISIGETTYTSYVLQRQLKGIQNLQDTYINGTLDIF